MDTMCGIINDLLEKNVVCHRNSISHGLEVKQPVVITPTYLFRITYLIYSLKQVV